MRVSFDETKRQLVLKEHGVDLAGAGRLLDGLCFEMADDRFDYGEERWVSIGELDGEVVVCIWADWGDDHVRVITMWKAKANEKKRYYDYLEQFLQG
jgi:uncharacterized DUF497 family protein